MHLRLILIHGRKSRQPVNPDILRHSFTDDGCRAFYSPGQAISVYPAYFMASALPVPISLQRCWFN